MQTYLFYDIETTGLNKSFDQVLQFAAIRTDLNLQEIERYELKIKLHPDIIPSPYAIITHKVGIQQMMSEGITEFDAIRQIHRLMNEPGTISLGYNTLGFDDEFLRFSFYRNLLKPYTHQYANQCSRMDIFPMTVMFYLFKNAVIKWPQKENRISLKLEELNNANQLFTGRAHDAMVDVEVTVELAKRFREEREMWDYLQGYFKKEIETERTNPLKADTALLVNSRMGFNAAFQCPVLFLGTHQVYKNQTRWLRLDTEDFSTIDPANLLEKVWVVNKKPAEPDFILPFKDRFLGWMSSERLTLAEKNKQWLKNQPEVFENIIQHFIHYTYPVIPNSDVESGIYVNGFLTNEDEFFCQRFHNANAKEKFALLEKAVNPKLKMLAQRILARNFPDESQVEIVDMFAKHLEKVNAENVEQALIDYQGNKRLTPRMAIAEIEQIRKEKVLSEGDVKLLREFEEYLRKQFHL